MKKIYLGADHAGFELKEKLKSWLKKNKFNYLDLGSHTFNPDDDYPDFAEKVAKRAAKEKALGILVCGSAQGMCIAANKVPGARAVIPFSVKEARLSREHNDANIICLSGWGTPFLRATKILEKFLTTTFSKDVRHVRRINKIKRIEKR